MARETTMQSFEEARASTVDLRRTRSATIVSSANWPCSSAAGGVRVNVSKPLAAARPQPVHRKAVHDGAPPTPVMWLIWLPKSLRPPDRPEIPLMPEVLRDIPDTTDTRFAIVLVDEPRWQRWPKTQRSCVQAPIQREERTSI